MKHEQGQGMVEVGLALMMVVLGLVAIIYVFSPIVEVVFAGLPH